MRTTLLALLVVVGIFVVYRAFTSLDPTNSTPTVPPVRTEFVLGEWYCCLTDDHPERLYNYNPEAGGFGGRSGYPVTE